MRRRAAAISFFYAALASGALLSQQPGWGVVPPSGFGDPHRPILDVASPKPAPASVPPGAGPGTAQTQTYTAAATLSIQAQRRGSSVPRASTRASSPKWRERSAGC